MLCPVCNHEFDGRCHPKRCRNCGFPLGMWQSCPNTDRETFIKNTIEPCKLVYDKLQYEAEKRRRESDIQCFGFDTEDISDIVVEEIDTSMGDYYSYRDIARYPQKYYGKQIICKCKIIKKEEYYSYADLYYDFEDPEKYPPDGLSLVCRYSFVDSDPSDLVYLNIENPERLGLRLLENDEILVVGTLSGINKRKDLPFILVSHIKLL